MVYERDGHEVLTLEFIKTKTQDVIVKKHHTMFCHAKAEASAVSALGEVSLSVSLTRWDDGTLITDEDKMVSLLVDGQQVDEVQTVVGTATFQVQFTDPGAYAIRVEAPLCQPVELEVLV